MCGYIGTLSLDQINLDKIVSQNKNIVCRGPDEKIIKSGNISEFNNNIDINYSFIFNRLSIIDLSSGASQPMFSRQYNSMIMFNGEIFNHRELRKRLENEGVKFYSDHSDTEVVLNGISKHGKDFVNLLIGQFAFVFIDFNLMKFYLIRDRLGQKPLFYSINDKSISFSSNLRSLVNISGQSSIDYSSLSDYINYGVIPSPKTLFKNVYKLKPAEVIELAFDRSFSIKKKELYWQIDNFVNTNKFNKEEFYELFNDAVELRKEADVDIGALLSGGIDSTSVVKALSKNSSTINTFSIGYEDNKYDESQWFEKVVNKYSTNHITEKITNRDVDNYVHESIDAFDEPYSDPSTVPSYVISKKISNYYKVALTGDGGDELLGGYTRTQQILTFRKYNDKFISNILKLYPWYFGTGNKISSRSSNLVSNYSSYLSDKKLLNKMNLEDNYMIENEYLSSSSTDIKKYMLADFKFYLSEMMMLKVDRTSMSNSLEARSPFVDHRLVEYCLNSNLDFVIGDPKSVLKDYLGTDFDKDFLSRRKMGFVFNLEDWVYKNLNNIFDYFEENEYFSDVYNLDLVKSLKTRKSRINAHRIWKLFIIEKYIQSF